MYLCGYCIGVCLYLVYVMTQERINRRRMQLSKCQQSIIITAVTLELPYLEVTVLRYYFMHDILSCALDQHKFKLVAEIFACNVRECYNALLVCSL